MYIFASSKNWHKPLFNNLVAINPNRWLYASNPGELNEVIAKGAVEYIFFLHWNWLVSEVVWSKHECVCFHMTDVPYGRGGESPSKFDN